jgi:hypothetical protein
MGILVTLAVVGVLVKQQLSAGPDTVPTSRTSGVSVPITTPGATAQEQSVQVQQQVKQSVEATLQAPRGEPSQ